MRLSSQSFKHVKASSISIAKVFPMSPIIFIDMEKAYSDATVDIDGVSISHAILDSIGKVDS